MLGGCSCLNCALSVGSSDISVHVITFKRLGWAVRLYFYYVFIGEVRSVYDLPMSSIVYVER